MPSADLEAAYAPFIASLLAGRFDAPPPGEWTAELVAAHVARNNDLIAETAEKVSAGQAVAYDNAAAVDDEELARYASEAGGLAGLAAEVERSAARQAAALASLGDLALTEVHAVIRDHGQVVVDAPMAIGAFIEGNASFHLDLHYAQLKALGQDWVANPPDAFDQYQLVLLERAPNPPAADDDAKQALQREHLGHFARMRAAGFLKLAGPIRGDAAIAGICVYAAGSVQKARALAEDDPAVRAGEFTIRAMDWYTAKDALRWPD
jgi:uncharacterized protein YciI